VSSPSNGGTPVKHSNNTTSRHVRARIDSAGRSAPARARNLARCPDTRRVPAELRWRPLPREKIPKSYTLTLICSTRRPLITFEA